MSGDSDFDDLLDDCLNDFEAPTQEQNTIKRNYDSNSGLLDKKQETSTLHGLDDDLDLDDILDDLENVNLDSKPVQPDEFDVLKVLPENERSQWRSTIESDTIAMGLTNHLPLSRAYTNKPSNYVKMNSIENLFLYNLDQSFVTSDVYIEDLTLKPSKELIQAYGKLLKEEVNKRKARFQK